MSQPTGRLVRVPRAVHWLSAGFVVGQLVLVAYVQGRLPATVLLGSFAGQSKTGPKELLWLFPAVSVVMIVLARALPLLPSSGIAGPDGKVSRRNERLAELLAASFFALAIACVGIMAVACVLEKRRHPAAALGEPVVAVLMTVVPPLLLLLFSIFRRRTT